MKTFAKKMLSLVLAAAFVISMGIMGSAQKTVFADNAYCTVVTASDFQHNGNDAYDLFGTILNLAVKQGLPEPDSMLVGGDYTMVLLDNAVPGISKIRGTYMNAFPNADPASVVCIQGNHDNPKDEFAETGFYNMGKYCLYVINENDFPWKQSQRKPDGVKAVAADIEKNLDAMISAGDKRPVIVMTHVPLHHTGRNSYGDNMYSSYIFNVLNEKAKQLDIIFIFGHNHSSKYDDYIGGSVNFMAPGDTIRIPFPDKKGADCYYDKVLNFTYTNCGYIGYSDNTVSDTSTNVLTLGFIQFTSDKIRFIKMSDQGVVSSKEVSKVNRGTFSQNPEYPALDDSCICHSNNAFLKVIWKVHIFWCKVFKANQFCVCGQRHY